MNLETNRVPDPSEQDQEVGEEEASKPLLRARLLKSENVPLGSLYGINNAADIIRKSGQQLVGIPKCYKHIEKGLKNGHYTPLELPSGQRIAVVNCCVCHQPFHSMQGFDDSADSIERPTGNYPHL